MTKKVTRVVTRIAEYLKQGGVTSPGSKRNRIEVVEPGESTGPRLVLGNLDAKRDWGHAKDYVRAMWMMLQTPDPEDYVIATGTQITVREFVTRCFIIVGECGSISTLVSSVVSTSFPLVSSVVFMY